MMCQTDQAEIQPRQIKCQNIDPIIPKTRDRHLYLGGTVPAEYLSRRALRKYGYPSTRQAAHPSV